MSWGFERRRGVWQGWSSARHREGGADFTHPRAWRAFLSPGGTVDQDGATEADLIEQTRDPVRSASGFTAAVFGQGVPG